MRLICGLMRLDGAIASPSLLKSMLAQMDVPRLRPGRFEFCDGAVAMAVLDFSASSREPFTGTAIAADVRLDEPDELARSLNVSEQNPDTLLHEVIRRFGAPGLELVLGDFAFAAWDGERLICGRDIFGVRPFSYVYKPGELFAFASVPSALHGSGIVPKKIDINTLVRRVMRSLRFDDSLIEGIARLPPAHTLEVSRNGISLQRYWRPDRKSLGAARITPEGAAEELGLRVEQAVRSRLPNGSQVGAHISGGLDSSAIAILAARALREEGRTLHAYSFLDRLRDGIQLEDETEFVKACLAQEGDIDWKPVRPTTREFEHGFTADADLMHSLDPDDPENQVAALAERQCVDLILSGWGGDEAATFNGRGTMAELFRRGRWHDLDREIDALAKERRWTRRGVFFQEVVVPLIDEFVPDNLVQLARRAVGKKPDHLELIHGALVPEARHKLKDAPGLFMVGDGRENRWRLINGPHIAHRTEIWAQIGARHGLAYAFPLLDRRVVDFALSLPSELFVRSGSRRRSFRDAMQGVLPENVRRRHQKYQPFPGRLLDLAEARDTLLARLTVLEGKANTRAILDIGQLRKLAASFPSANKVRKEMAQGSDPQEREAMIAVSRVLELATYLDQHGQDRDFAPAKLADAPALDETCGDAAENRTDR